MNSEVCSIDINALLYLIYVNDCFRCLHFSCSILYADDTTLIICAKTYDELLKSMHEDLKNLYNWLCLNKTVHVATVYLHSSHAQERNFLPM